MFTTFHRSPLWFGFTIVDPGFRLCDNSWQEALTACTLTLQDTSDNCLPFLCPYGTINDTQQTQTLEKPCTSIIAITLTDEMNRMEHNSTDVIWWLLGISSSTQQVLSGITAVRGWPLLDFPWSSALSISAPSIWSDVHGYKLASHPSDQELNHCSLFQLHLYLPYQTEDAAVIIWVQ
jgi:hypothetical protein